MRLEQSETALFYQLWFPLLDFVNRMHFLVCCHGTSEISNSLLVRSTFLTVQPAVEVEAV